jgi:Domain of Unknown Function (DUF1080)
MRILVPVAALALALLDVNPAGEVPRFAREIPAIRSGEPRFAFNGKDLSGFYPFTRFHHDQDPDRVFAVQDGMIRVSGKEFGGLATLESYANYHLVVEWKWGSKTWHPRRYNARNSGVMVHCVGPDGGAFASWMASIECQILEGGSGDLLVVPGKGESPSLTSEVLRGEDGQPYYRKGGERKTLRAGRFNWWGRDPGWKDVLWFRGPLDVEKPHGEWNRMEIVCDGDSIAYVLNGVLVNAAAGAAWSSGKILLQSEGAEVFFRKFEVRPLRK